MWIKILYFCFLTILFGITTALAQSTETKADSTLEISFLLHPSYQNISLASQPLFSFSTSAYSKEVPFKALLGLTSSILKSKYRDPFNFPYYGLGIERPHYFLEPRSVTDYQLSLMRLNQYHPLSY